MTTGAVADDGTMTQSSDAVPGPPAARRVEAAEPAPFMVVGEADTAELTALRFGLLRDIVAASHRTNSLTDLLSAVVGDVALRLPGILGALLSRGENGWQVSWTAPEHAGDGFDFAGAVAACLPERVAGYSGAMVAPGDAAVIVIPIPGALAADRALAFADPEGVVSVPRDLMAHLAQDCTYVLNREVERHRLAERERQFRAVFDASPIPQAMMAQGRRNELVVNDALCRLVGRTRSELTGPNPVVVTHPDEVEAVHAARKAAAADPSGQYHMARRLLHASGEVVYTQSVLTWVVLPDGGRTLLMQFQDVTAHRRAEQDLLRQAETDSLTGIGNRLRLVRLIDEMGEAAESFGVLFLDVDNFKLINDTRGHDVGDEILRAVAERLTAVCGPQDEVVRFGGDEFVLLCRAPDASGDVASGGPASTDRADGEPAPADQAADGQTPVAVAVRALADRVQAALAAPVPTVSGQAHITVSIGICDDTIPVTRPLDRLQYADTAAYRAKRLGEDRQVVYDTGLHRTSVEYRRVESLLRTALEEDRLLIHYQPIVSIEGGEPIGVEALVRMRDRDGRLIPPGDFIEVAERSGLIVPMGAWVLTETCRFVESLRGTSGAPLRASVNVSARQAARTDLVDVVTSALSESGLHPSALTLELTESALLEADDSTLDRLNQLRESGIRIALDDFGTGYSSLVYLRQLPVTTIKVDQSFVGTMTTDSGSSAIVRAVTALAADLGLSWIAEGVETAEQWRALRGLGDGFAQGYFFARPQAAGDLEATLAALPPQPLPQGVA